MAYIIFQDSADIDNKVEHKGSKSSLLATLKTLQEGMNTLHEKFDKEKDSANKMCKEDKEKLEEKIRNERCRYEVTKIELHNAMEFIKKLQEENTELKRTGNRLPNIQTDLIEEKKTENIQLHDELKQIKKEKRQLSKLKTEELDLKDMELQRLKRDLEEMKKEIKGCNLPHRLLGGSTTGNSGIGRLPQDIDLSRSTATPAMNLNTIRRTWGRRDSIRTAGMTCNDT